MALKAMRELPDYVMAEGSPDVEGWQVHDRDHHVAGTVIDLVVDTQGDEVRYLVVQLTNGKSVLMALGELDLDEATGVVRQVRMSRSDMEALPVYTPPVLSQELEERYYVLFKREEPVGAADMSPLDYRIPPFRARGDRMDRLMRGPRRKSGEQAPGGPLFARRRDGSAQGAQPLPGMPGKGPGLFAENAPWSPEKQAAEPSGDRMGPEADAEALWQSEQPGISSAFGARRDLPEEER